MTASLPSRTAVGALHVRLIDLSQCNARDQTAWADLEQRAVEPNAYMSPHFVLPALRLLPTGCKPYGLAVERDGVTSREMVALALLMRSDKHRLMPLPHLRALSARHSYLDGPLIDASQPETFAAVLLRALCRHSGAHAGMLWHALPAGGVIERVLREQATAQFDRTMLLGSFERPILRAHSTSTGAHTESAKERKERARCWRRLRELGSVQWQNHQQGLPPDSAEAFLSLEHASWKGEEGTSLLSNPLDAQFFREMVARFAAAERAWFSELRLDGRVIASSFNLHSGSQAFAFKVASDRTLKHLGVGLLNELELIMHYESVCPAVQMIDSGASSDSFIASLWPERRTLCTVFMPFGPVGRAALQVRAALRQLSRRRLGGVRT